MAKIQEELIIIKVSRLLKDSAEGTSRILDPQNVESLEAVIQELTGGDVLVEIATE
jgi:hypothetical protein